MAVDPCAVLLAAGASRRLGQPKQMLRRNGETLLQRAARLMAEAGARDVVVVLGPQGQPWCELLRPPARAVFNPDPSRGRLSSLRCAIDALSAADPATPILLGLVDQPALESAHLQALLRAAAEIGGAVSRHDGQCGPPAVWPLAWLRALPAEGDDGLRRLQQCYSTQIVQVDRVGCGFDLDTPDDLLRARLAGLIDPE